MPEENHHSGKVGVTRVKRLLEASLRFNLPYNSYEHIERVTLKMVTGERKAYDLNGGFLDEQGQERTRVYIESKNLKTAGSQSNEFSRFLVQAYSATLCAVQEYGHDPKYEFMWATTCPWIGDGFCDVASEDALRTEVVKEVERDESVLIGKKRVPKLLPNDHEIEEQVLRSVSNRLLVWVISNRHEDITPDPKRAGMLLERLKEVAV